MGGRFPPYVGMVHSMVKADNALKHGLELEFVVDWKCEGSR